MDALAAVAAEILEGAAGLAGSCPLMRTAVDRRASGILWILSVKWTTPFWSIQRKKSAACEREIKTRSRICNSAAVIEVLMDEFYHNHLTKKRLYYVFRSWIGRLAKNQRVPTARRQAARRSCSFTISGHYVRKCR